MSEAKVKPEETSPDSDSAKQAEDGTGFSFLDQPVAAECPLSTKPGVNDVLRNSQDHHSEDSEDKELMPDVHNSTSERVDALTEDCGIAQPNEVRDPVAEKLIKIPKRTTTKQLALTASEKKKKRKAFRPGQGVSKEEVREEDPSSTGQESGGAVAVELEPVTKQQEPAVAEITGVMEKKQELVDEDKAIIGDEHVLPVTLPPGHSSGHIASLENDCSISDGELSPSGKEELAGEKNTLIEGTMHGDSASDDTTWQGSSLGNYNVQFTHEESLAGLLQSYGSGLSKLR